jgi:hypothetical protein
LEKLRELREEAIAQIPNARANASPLKRELIAVVGYLNAGIQFLSFLSDSDVPESQLPGSRRHPETVASWTPFEGLDAE